MSQPESLKISYILPDFDEYALSGGLYVIFEHCNGLIRRGHKVRAFNNTGKSSRYLKLDCEVEKHGYDTRVIESDAPDIIVGTHWRTYFFINKMKKAIPNNTKLFFLIQSDDRFLVIDEEKPLIDIAIKGRYKDVIDIKKIAISRYLQHVLKDVFEEDALYVKNGLNVKEVLPLLPKSDKVRILARYDPSGYRGWNLVNSVLSKIDASRPDDVEVHLFEMKKKKPTRYKSIFHEGLSGDRLLSLSRSCDIYLSGSLHEGFSYPTIEAMSQGACVCATDAGGNREFCIDEETALLSPRGDEKSLYDNLLRLVNDKNLREKLSHNGINKAKEFNWEESISELENIFKSASGQRYDPVTLVVPEEEAREGQAKKRALLVYDKDPFSDYKDWLSLADSIKHIRSSGFDIEVVMLIDKHAAKSVDARLRMFVDNDDLRIFKPKIFYSRKIKIRLKAVNSLAFFGIVLCKILFNVFSKKRRYDAVIFRRAYKGRK